MEYLVSIIIPVYNAEKYLAACIEGVLAQTMKNFELLLIDDGSKDNSGKICDQYAENDERITVFHQANGGVSSARNFGIEKSSGKYITFIDSDDLVEPNYLEVLISASENDKYDFVHAIFSDSEQIEAIAADYDYSEQNHPNYSPLIQFGAVYPNLFKKDIMVKNNLRFKKEITYAEDTIFVYEYLSCCERIRVITDVIYHYNTLNPTSASHKMHNNIDVFIAKRNAAFFAFLQKLNFDDKTRTMLMDCFAYSSFSHLIWYVYYVGDKKCLKSIFEKNFDNYKKSLQNIHLSIKNKDKTVLNIFPSKDIKTVFRFTKINNYKQLTRTLFVIRLTNLLKHSPDEIVKRVFRKIKLRLS